MVDGSARRGKTATIAGKQLQAGQGGDRCLLPHLGNTRVFLAIEAANLANLGAFRYFSHPTPLRCERNGPV